MGALHKIGRDRLQMFEHRAADVEDHLLGQQGRRALLQPRDEGIGGGQRDETADREAQRGVRATETGIDRVAQRQRDRHLRADEQRHRPQHQRGANPVWP